MIQNDIHIAGCEILFPCGAELTTDKKKIVNLG